MSTITEIKEDLKTVSAVRNITKNYQEIANLKMKKIREHVFKNREFFKELINIHKRIKSARLNFLKNTAAMKGKIIYQKRKKLKKTAIVVFSANGFLYGPLLLNIWKEMTKYISQNREKTDLIVVGRVGKHFAEKEKLGHKIFYFELNDDEPEEKNIVQLINFIMDYKKILVFHGKYESVINQTPTISEVSTEFLFEKETKPKTDSAVSYIFEPSAEEILDFFETEITATLLNQTILEHQLSRYASRVMSMYQANENAKNMEKKLKFIKNNLERQTFNKKQTEFFGGFLSKNNL